MVDEPAPPETAPSYRLDDLCESCVVDKTVVVEMIEYGILSPEGEDPTTWRFETNAVLKLKRAQRLRHDLDLNLAGVAVALDLIDELSAMKQRVKTLESHLAQLIEND